MLDHRLVIFLSVYCSYLIAPLYASSGDLACPNNCNKHGTCNRWQACECYTGWAGTDCSRRSCPTGRALSDIPSATDTAHAYAECSGQGICDYSTGNCACNPSHSGGNCGKTKCKDDCNGHGQCISLRTAATLNDGYMFNRTTVYTQWDADIIHGCNCDPGYSGADCSERTCEYGIDPRVSTQPTETVTLVCDCTKYGWCKGRYKLKFLGRNFRSWFDMNTKASDITSSLMSVPGLLDNSPGHRYLPVTTENATLGNQLVCVPGEVVRTRITFNRNTGDLPALTFYANSLTHGDVYFETKQTLVCDCEYHFCNGTFRFSFEGEMSESLNVGSNGDAIHSALSAMSTVTATNIKVVSVTNQPVCIPGVVQNTSIVFKAPLGNVPPLGLWSSVQMTFESQPTYYTTKNSTEVLKLVTEDGRNDNTKLCNGIGSCNFTDARCTCPFGWGFDADFGPCGAPVINTSDWPGVARCPGIIPVNFDVFPDGKATEQSARQNYQTRIYVSNNPLNPDREDLTNISYSMIYYYDWAPTDKVISIVETDKTKFVTMTSNTSAGPLVLDNAGQQIFYVDKNPANRFIGVASIEPGNGYGNSKVFLQVNYEIFGFAFDASNFQRKLYWTVPGVYDAVDGAIYYASIDATTPTAVSLVSAIGQANIINPYGIVIHHFKNKIMWVDRESTKTNSVLNQADKDGSHFEQFILFKTVDGHTVSTNATDLVVDFQHNNTAIFIDAGNPAAIIATNLDAPIMYNNLTNDDDQHEEYATTRIITNTTYSPMGAPSYLILDEHIQQVIWTDIEEHSIGFARYKKPRSTDINKFGVAYKGTLDYPVGLVFDRGFASPTWGQYLDCYGNGRCLGLAGNYRCECNKGYYGDCQAAQCPFGPAWFNEPAVDEIAHDVSVECSNVGKCDRESGKCLCMKGFEGTACERKTCPGNSNCNGKGRCLSMRNLGKHHKNEHNDLDPVVYGSTQNSAYTWDADRIYGCLPDEYGYFERTHNITSYAGLALDRQECPVGYNSRYIDTQFNVSHNYTQYIEVQRIECKAIQGSFKLKFRGLQTDLISYDASEITLELALEAVPTVGDVRVEFSDGSSGLCTNSYAEITFISNIGLVPLLALVDDVTNTLYGRTFSVSRISETGNNALVECAGHGTCDSTTGLCACFDQYGSSDGYGNQGSRGDCGYNLISG